METAGYEVVHSQWVSSYERSPACTVHEEAGESWSRLESTVFLRARATGPLWRCNKTKPGPWA